MCEREGSGEEVTELAGVLVPHMGPGRSWKVATTLIITVAITSHPLPMPPAGPSIPGHSHPACPGGPLSSF